MKSGKKRRSNVLPGMESFCFTFTCGSPTATKRHRLSEIDDRDDGDAEENRRRKYRRSTPSSSRFHSAVPPQLSSHEHFAVDVPEGTSILKVVSADSKVMRCLKRVLGRSPESSTDVSVHSAAWLAYRPRGKQLHAVNS
eukprot:ANDGO_02911.mRNA.1 hypothetical protein